jgi:hypothetical protein
MRGALLIPLSLLAATSAHALPPGSEARGFRDGANHHLGDDSFVAATGRAPTARDAEAERMHVHLAYVRAQLAAQPATRPALAARRAELLGYLDDYIARRITPHNDALPWRSPVFIDDDGRICAVGYLIERSVGRALADRIAGGHRYDFLEDIAEAMPEVQAWVDGSGFTLAELASIQPGYEQARVEDWVRWNLRALPVADGAYQDKKTTGAWRHNRMEGAWVRTDHGHVVGRGTLHHGDGAWTSFYRDGTKMASGPMVHNDPHGKWTLFHPSGNVAAEGRFAHGLRDGGWRFYYDTPARTPIATGEFAGGTLVGEWRHFDASGALLAVTDHVNSPAGDHDWGFGYNVMRVVPDANGVVHEAQLMAGPDGHRIDVYRRGRDRLFDVQRGGAEAVYDADANQLVHADGGWQAVPCQWSAKRKRLVRSGDLVAIELELDQDLADVPADQRPTCGAAVAVSAARGAAIDQLLAQRTQVRQLTPTFVRQLALGEFANGAKATADESPAPGDQAAEPSPTFVDLPRMIAANMAWYTEWPYVDERFVQLFKTVPGYWQGKPNNAARDESERTQPDYDDQREEWDNDNAAAADTTP